ncbi:glycoside hydrolase family 3 N-terminal domain-containing protein [Bacteroides caecigallinarum]|uniref:glycoside hydrolase family 3 N-terminal domain-containing protein n=1 Tax=Bacteroides caecigallinarum TaxID=1411144 RepID=UPI001F3BA45C|nr:glycoside hydrolase family 3 N-terminal domain-containing protein [Bacteroides caecigallinarum]MCF2550482.1 glycoside hydrolase family 3 C-terminal domain-containing protein [Bacteroides caecigallinarum]
MNFKRLLLVSSIIGNAACLVQAATPAGLTKDANIEKKVEATLSRMTLDEKVGQMTELSIDVLGSVVEGEFKLDKEKVKNAIGKYKVGSVLNAPGPVAQSREKWKEIIGYIQEVSMKEIGIPCIYGLDQNHGTTYTLGGTLFPQNINLGAAFNPELTYESAVVTAYETRASNCPWTYSPTVDMARDPRWSRVWENYGEDCLINAIMGSEAVRGFQGDDPNHIPGDRVAASVKHYLGYSMSRTGKDRTPAYISESDLREKCFAPFKACVETGALTIMVNSASINGVPVHANKQLLTEWLKEDLAWDGMLITDWADINNLYTREKVAANKKEAIEIAINAGIDMAMEPYDLDFCTLLKELVEEGRVPMSRIDDAVRRILRLKYRLGLFDNPNTDYNDYPKFGSKEHAAIALKAAEESEVLLKNKNNILPLSKGKKILVTGPNANSMRCLNGGWSYTWQGHLADRFAGEYNTIYEAVSNKFGADMVTLEQGVTYVAEGAYYEENAPEIDKAVAAAKNADVILACIGENSYCETPGNLADLAISENQRNLVKALAETGKPIVLVINSGRPRIISDIEPIADAVINVLLPGNYGGDALANILAGDANPSAKMPYTYPRNQAELTTYDYRVSEEMDKMEGAYDYDAVISVQWPFGYGLSYTTFEYKNLHVNKEAFTENDKLEFTIDVTNTGKVAGKEVVMLFSSDLVASLTPENRRLRAFSKVELQPGETKTVTLTIKGSDLAFVGADGNWILEKGDFRMQVGNQVVNVKCSDTYKWNTANICVNK